MRALQLRAENRSRILITSGANEPAADLGGDTAFAVTRDSRLLPLAAAAPDR